METSDGALDFGSGVTVPMVTAQMAVVIKFGGDGLAVWAKATHGAVSNIRWRGFRPAGSPAFSSRSHASGRPKLQLASANQPVPGALVGLIEFAFDTGTKALSVALASRPMVSCWLSRAVLLSSATAPALWLPVAWLT